MTKTQKENLKRRISSLRTKVGIDVLEAKQIDLSTEDVLNLYQKRINILENKLNAKKLKQYTLKNDSGEELSIKLVSSAPDPSNWVISIKSPIGQKLLSSNIQDVITLGINNYTVINIA